MANIGRKEAQAIVNKLRRKNGGLSPEQRERMDEEDLEMIENLREQLGGSVQSLATNLYSTDTRFVFELIQNAEDNNYTKAKAEKERPYLSFTIHPDRIIVDSNEDGFTEDNVQAICSITKSGKVVSSKSKEQRKRGYIGEKGIGFKSVFKVASKVHIQSEPFSFCFEYNRESPSETGMGMITPFFEEHKEVPTGTQTRMTLHLAPTADFENLVKQFSDPNHLPDSLLMFLSQINKLDIVVHDTVGLVSRNTYFYEYDAKNRRGKLTKSSPHGLSEVTYYHVTKKQFDSLPKDPARENETSAEVVLAFPIDSNGMPVIEQQHVFAYLPMRQAGLSFLIQSDFVTQASREDLSNSPRNEALLDGVAATFREAVLQFCKHPTLRFHWMKYLPSKSISQPFWAKLLPKIIKLLQDTPIWLSRSGKSWKCASHLKELSPDTLDEERNPLFDDLPNELYLSDGYGSCDRATLAMLGINIISVDEIIERVRADLINPNSRMKSPMTTKSWYERSAHLLLSPFKENNSRLIQQIKNLSLIPLGDGSWVPSAIGQIFYPEDGRVPVPTDLGIRLVEAMALEVPSRKALFSELGIRAPKSQGVVNLIIGKYKKFNAVDLYHSIEHLRYLYWKLPADQKSLDRTIYLKDHANQPVYRTFITFGERDLIADDLYFESEDVYGTSKLLAELRNGENIIAPGWPVHFINRAYLDAVSSKAMQNNTSWKDWLATFAEVRSIPRLVSRGDDAKMSSIFVYILYWRKDRVVGTLKAHWTSYGPLMKGEILRELCEASVPCDATADTPLAGTYMPLSDLKGYCSKLRVEAAVPFLKLPTALNEKSLAEWDFLKTFQVHYTPDLDFYIHILRYLRSNNETLSEREEDSLFTVYEEIERQSREDDYGRLRSLFADRTAVYVPASGSRKAQWVTPKTCVWEGPEFLNVMHSLATAGRYRNSSRLKHLFNAILEIRNAGWNEYVLQVQNEKQQREPHVELSIIYNHILKEGPGREIWDIIRGRFEEDRLVYIPQSKSWSPPSSCLWAIESHIENKAAIAHHYPALQEFFVDRLLVNKPDIPMLVQEVLAMAAQETPRIQAIKDLFRELNSFGPRAPALDRLKEAPVIPVKGTDGLVRLLKATDAFAIIDRVPYMELFANKIPIMDYTREETHDLESLISALGLEGRYISRLVQELSMVNGASKHVALSDRFQRKAYSIFRCAVHYRAAVPHDKALFDRFRDIEVCVSDKIIKTVRISLEGLEPVTIEGEKAILHIEEINNHLKLYVPQGKEDRELCFATLLPDRLTAYLGILEPQAVMVFGNLLNVSTSIVDKTLETHGIVPLPWTEPVQQSTSSHENVESDEEDVDEPRPGLTSRQPSGSRGNTPERGHDSSQRTSSVRARLGSSTNSSYGRETDCSYRRSPFTPTTSGFTGSLNTPRSSLTPTRVSVQLQTEPIGTLPIVEYVALLNYVIAAATAAALQTLGLPPPAEHFEPPELTDTCFGKRAENPITHDIKVGAAGELYVFEFLQGLGLPNFSRDNWRSNVRKAVCVHEKYRDMPDWKGQETADIVYEDCGPDHKLTAFLSRYLLPEHRLHERENIKYYLEVKTTTGDCGNRFFLSKAQYNRMERMALTEGQPATAVYVILRVYNLGQRNMAIQYYVDPWAWKVKEDLVIEAESYTVTENL